MANAVPVVIQKPIVHITDAAPSSTAVDVSCDVQRLELSPDQPVNEITRFCGTVQVPGLLTESCSVDYLVNDDTATRWAPLVGKHVKVEIAESATDAKPRTFDSYIGFNPGLYGAFEPGEALLVGGQNLPVMSKVTQGSKALS